eukprot:5948091-Pyramimonas_sp.AAC.1
MVQESLSGHVASSILPMILPPQGIRSIMPSLSVRTVLCRWGPELCSCRLVFHRHIGPTRSDISAYATILEPPLKGSPVGKDASDANLMLRFFPSDHLFVMCLRPNP